MTSRKRSGSILRISRGSTLSHRRTPRQAGSIVQRRSPMRRSASRRPVRWPTRYGTGGRRTAAIFVALGSFLLPAAAHAQSTIAGVVKDTSGAILPGVIVEASSDVLTERTRSVITDAAGQYKIVDLRPGVYVVTFTLPGFQTFRRDGLELPSSFTATVNADLRVGGLEETLTVTGESPVVDVQSTVHTQVLSREVLDALPTGRTIQGVGQL